MLHNAFEFLAATVDELDPQMRFNEYNHTPHFPSCVTCLCDVVPVGSVGGVWKRELFSGYYHKCVFKLLVVTDLLGHILAWSGPCFGSVADLTIYKPFSKRVLPLEPWEVMLADGSFVGQPNVIVPYRKPPRGELTAHDSTYNQVHRMYRARVEHMFGILWHFALFKNIWLGDVATLTKRLKVLIHFVNFSLKRGFTYRPLGPWPHHTSDSTNYTALAVHRIMRGMSTSDDVSTDPKTLLMGMTIWDYLHHWELSPELGTKKGTSVRSGDSDMEVTHKKLAVSKGAWLSTQHIIMMQQELGDHPSYLEPCSCTQLYKYLSFALQVANGLKTRNVDEDDLFRPHVQACNTSSSSVPTGLEHWVTVAFDLSHKPTESEQVNLLLVEPAVSRYSTQMKSELERKKYNVTWICTDHQVCDWRCGYFYLHYSKQLLQVGPREWGESSLLPDLPPLFMDQCLQAFICHDACQEHVSESLCDGDRTHDLEKVPLVPQWAHWLILLHLIRQNGQPHTILLKVTILVLIRHPHLPSRNARS